MDERLESWPLDPLSLSLSLREGVEASFASNNYTTDVESLASHYTSVVTRFKTLVSMYPR